MKPFSLQVKVASKKRQHQDLRPRKHNRNLVRQPKWSKQPHHPDQQPRDTWGLQNFEGQTAWLPQLGKHFLSFLALSHPVFPPSHFLQCSKAQHSIQNFLFVEKWCIVPHHLNQFQKSTDQDQNTLITKWNISGYLPLQRKHDSTFRAGTFDAAFVSIGRTLKKTPKLKTPLRSNFRSL